VIDVLIARALNVGVAGDVDRERVLSD